jgi:hypothetical protein
MSWNRVAVRWRLASAIVICIAYGLLSDYGMTRSILKGGLPDTESSLPSNIVHSVEEGRYPPLGDDERQIALEEHAPPRVVELPKEAIGPMEGGERHVSKEKGELKRISGGSLVSIQGSEGEQSEGNIYDNMKEPDAATFGRIQSEKFPYKDEERENVSDEVAVPQQGGKSEQSEDTHYGHNNTIICFVTSVFGTSVEKADKPPNVENIFPNDTASDHDFLLFTNLENLTSHGWTNIVLTDLPYRRFITQSRWGKFVGWRHQGLAHCGIVIYMDAYVKPQTKNGLAPFCKIAKRVSESEVGLAQITHPLNGLSFEKILTATLKTKKDVVANTNATMQWLREQPDFAKRLPYYLNKWFAYDPSNPRFQEVSNFFWDRYSQELDSWRDQPLWSYSLHHFKVKPVVLYKRGTRRDLFIENLETRGFGGHMHDESNDKDASNFRGNQAKKLTFQ